MQACSYCARTTFTTYLAICLVSRSIATWDRVIFNGVRIGLLFGRQWFKQFALNNIKWRYQNVYVLYILHAQD